MSANSATTDQITSALAGVRVVDMSTVVMGPFAAQIMGDLGADVIKVEPPDGESTRRLHPQRHPGMSALAMNVNRNKRSLGVNLKDPRGREILLKLLENTDILVTNMRSGALQRLNLDHHQIADRFPRLIYCHAQGFRSDSVLANRAAYDEIVQAASGLSDLMRRVTGRPYYVPTVLGDKLCSLTTVYSALAALHSRDRTGRGQLVEVPMTDTLLAFNLVEHMEGLTFEPPLGPIGFSRSVTPTHRAVATKDGWACILPYSVRNIQDFLVFIGRPDLAEDPRFTTPAGLVQHQAELYELIEETAVRATTAEWERFCAEHSIPFAPLLDIEKVTEDPYVTEGELIQVAEHPTEGAYRVVRPPVRFSATPATIRRHCPRPGEQSAEVLSEIGYPAEAIRDLVARGVVGAELVDVL
ncbi:CaiB/BaiF CoA transferase family protein [Goodfellowiella coeruleoviolacea]|uniref:CaiB/BaiF CoA transferase family protein n=1 Tax=Goodfellowiella coeruleoviolacea TaxID=334858 RepID=UPI0027E0218D|nr:CoA transferase [Goodfellowiella coeruleoviolacea]